MAFTKKHRWYMLIPLVCFLLAAWAGGAAIKALIDHRSVATWQEVPARIITAQLDERSGGRRGNTVTYKAKATYSYEFQGQPYTGDRVTLHVGGDSTSAESEIYRQIEQSRASGQPFRCYVDPADPSQSILFRELRGTAMFGQFLAMVCFAAGGAWMWWEIVKDSRKAVA